jgi:hypothetical protein
LTIIETLSLKISLSFPRDDADKLFIGLSAINEKRSIK